MADASMMLEVVERVQESQNVISLRLKVVEGAFQPFLAGQHLPLRLDLPERKLATYTISSDPADHGGYRISVKIEPNGKGGSRFLHEVQVGARIAAERPRGKFVLADDARPVLLLTGGIGVTPALSMLSVLARQPERPVYFVHACLSATEHSFADEVAEIVTSAPNVRGYVAYAEGGETDVAAGRCQGLGLLSRETLRALLPLDAYHVYLCGPDGFMSAMRAALVSLGVADAEIHQETFGGGVSVVKKEAKRSALPEAVVTGVTEIGASPVVRFVKSGLEVAWDGSSDNLLELAEAQGLRPEFECRSGICGTCACRKLSGEVAYTEDLIDSPKEGEIFLCCSVPKGDVTLDL
ncbi:FAD-binding oxidoreductase [Celeribacter sp. SCSIO 80788]|uniref:FAD-binding oxidoreductase n=1 Tax=Celeribacter sp. SCSIO 80788 TaxID=3117013 RepID=UPI003DA60F19